jgi:hypothetical protein
VPSFFLEHHCALRKMLTVSSFFLTSTAH